ncbi:hypothetical protein DFH06DRAFT_1159625 [Mycena polygramma]|nr:hypothetical protein DFH06DRAFT_1159625 [Mycena polygramma]
MGVWYSFHQTPNPPGLGHGNANSTTHPSPACPIPLENAVVGDCADCSANLPSTTSSDSHLARSLAQRLSAPSPNQMTAHSSCLYLQVARVRPHYDFVARRILESYGADFPRGSRGFRLVSACIDWSDEYGLILTVWVHTRCSCRPSHTSHDSSVQVALCLQVVLLHVSRCTRYPRPSVLLYFLALHHEFRCLLSLALNSISRLAAFTPFLTPASLDPRTH